MSASAEQATASVVAPDGRFRGKIFPSRVRADGGILVEKGKNVHTSGDDCASILPEQAS